MRRALLPIAAVVLVALLWWALGREPARPGIDRDARGNSIGANARVSGQLNAIATAPLPEAKGNLGIRGIVRDAHGPVAGATVTATVQAPDALTELRVSCPDEELPVPLLEAECAEGLRQIVELVSERRGEAPPMARATTGVDGRYVLSGLEAGSYTLWADGPGSIAAKAGVRAGEESAELWLTSGAVIRGIVEDELEHPVAGAVVTAVNEKHSRFFDAVTGPDGHFALGPVLPGKVQLVAHAEGQLPAGTTLTHFTLTRLVELKLHRARSLRGRVLRDEAPAAGVKVRLESHDAEVLTSSDGSFSFDRLRPGEYQVVAADGSEQASAAVAIMLGADPPDVVLRLERGAEVSGIVLSEEGAPVVDAQISLKVDARAGRVERTAVSGPGGTFRFAALPPGRGMLSAKADGYLVPPLVHVVVAPGQPNAAKLILHHAVVVSGVVVDPDGAPLANAHVEAASASLHRDSEKTAADGGFTLDLPAADEYELLAVHDDFRATTLKVRAPASGIHLQLARGLELHGRLAGDDGEPIPFVEVIASRMELPARPSQGKFTAADGTFAFKGLEEGRHRLFANVSLARQERYAVANVEVPAPGPVELRLVQGGEISGRVVDTSGKPIADAQVRAGPDAPVSGDDSSDPENLEAGIDSGTARTSEDGSFTLSALRPGGYNLDAWKHEWRPPAGAPTANAHPGDTGVVIVLEPWDHLTGRVVDEAGRPITRFRLNMKPVETADGTFSEPIEDEAGVPGRTITFDAGPDYAIVSRPLPPVVSGERALGEVVLIAGQPVTGQVVDGTTGAPLAGALVDVGEANGLQGEMGPMARLGATVTGADGRFTIPRVDPSRHLQVFAEHPDYLRYSKPLERPAGNLLALERAASISGHVFAANGRPYRGEVHAFARDIDAQAPDAIIEPDGAYRLAGLPPGDYRIFVSGDEGFLPLGSFDVVMIPLRSGEARTQDLRERATGVKVEIHVTAPPRSESPAAILIPGALALPQTMKELDGLILRAQLPENEGDTVVASGTAAAGPTGRSTFSHVAPGHYTVLGGADVEGGGILVQLWPIEIASSDVELAFTLPATARVFREGDDAAPDAGQ